VAGKAIFGGKMNWIGKLAGAVLGYAAARLPGAIVGLVLGHQFDRGMAAPRTRRSRASGGRAPAERQRAFFEATFLIMGHLAKADGRVSEAELAVARSAMLRMRLDDGQTRLAMQLFNAGKQSGFPLDARIADLRHHCGREPELLRTFLELQRELALSKGGISAVERELLARMADGLGMGRLVLVQLEALVRARGGYGSQSAAPRAAGADLVRAYASLGISPEASDGEVKTAYRRLMNQHHPDKQAARGLPDSMLEIAKQRTAEIRAAYEAIREHRGMK